MSASVTKFKFDLDMADYASNRGMIKQSQQDKLLKAAREEGYQAGFKAGENSEQLRSNKELIAATNNLIKIATNMLAERNKMHKEILFQAIDLASATGRKLASKLIEKQPEVELKSIISECLSSIDDVPHLVIQCHPDLTDICKEAASELMKTSQFVGNLVVMGDPEILLGDGKIEWVDGGLVRDSESIMKEIDVSISNYLSANNITKPIKVRQTQPAGVRHESQPAGVRQDQPDGVRQDQPDDANKINQLENDNKENENG